MKARRRWPWVLLLAAAGVILGLWIWLYVAVPEPTALVVSVVHAETGDPLPGAAVRARPQSAQPLPIVTTDMTGTARFEDPLPDRAYTVRVQKVDYDLALEPGVGVPAQQETGLEVSLMAHPGGRLFVGLDKASVVEIDTASLRPVRRLLLPAEKQGQVGHLLMHPVEDLLYAFAGAEGYILDTRRSARAARLEMSRPPGATLSPVISAVGLSQDGQSLFVADAAGAGWLMMLDARSGRLLADTQMLGGRAEAVGFLVEKSGSVSVYIRQPAGGDEAVRELSAVVEEALDGWSIIIWPNGTLSADGQCFYFWVHGYFGGDDRLRDRLTVVPLGATTGIYTRILPVGTSALATSPSGQEVYVLNRPLGTLTILDPAVQKRRGLVLVGSDPEALAISPDGRWAYVANRKSETISVVDLPAASLEHTVPLPGEPLSLALWWRDVQEQ